MKLNDKLKMPVVCINLLEDWRRYEDMSRRLKRYGLDVRFYHPVRMPFARRIGLTNGGFNPGQEQGEVGCAISHYTVIKQGLHQNAGGLFVLEDDLRFRKDFAFELPKAIDALPRNWDAAMLYSFCPDYDGETLDNPYWNRAHNCWSNCAVLMKKSYMEAYIGEMDKGLQIADRITFKLQDKLNIYVLKTPLVIPRADIPSNIRENPNYESSFEGLNLELYD